MTINKNEVGKRIYVDTEFNLNAAPFTRISLRFTSPDGSVSFTRDNTEGVTAPNVDSPDLGGESGVLAANTYMVYVTKSGDFETEGYWTVCSKYEDNAPSLFNGEATQLPIGDSC